MKALIVSADRFEDSELLVPYYRLLEQGIETDIASVEKGEIVGKHGYRVDATRSLDQLEAGAYDLIVLPGGKAPAQLRKEEKLLDFIRQFFKQGKPIAAICHGPQVLVSAGVLSGKTVTCYKSVAAEVQEAGAHYLDKEVVVDGNLITSRIPPDLPWFMREIMKCVS